MTDTLQTAQESLRGNTTLIVLLVMSIATLAIGLEKLWWALSCRRRVAHARHSLLRHLSEGHAPSAVALNESLPAHPATELFDRVLRRDADAPGGELRRLQMALSRHARKRLWLVGSVASVAPFVGLMGTVLGIMRAFEAMAGEPGGGFAVVSQGISEALVTTAAGIFVAVEAVALFNGLQVLVGAALSDAKEAAEELSEARRMHTPDGGGARGQHGA